MSFFEMLKDLKRSFSKALSNYLGLPQPKFLRLFLLFSILIFPLRGCAEYFFGHLPRTWTIAYLIISGFISAIVWAEGQRAKRDSAYKLDDFIRVIVDKVEAIAILLAATLFTLEAPQRMLQQDLSIALSNTFPSHMRIESLERLVWRGKNLSGINLQGAALPKIRLSGAVLIGSNFSQANLAEASFDGAAIQEANFNEANLRNASFVGMPQNVEENKPYMISFKNTYLVNANFSSAAIVSSSSSILIPIAFFHNCDFRVANLEEANLSYSSFVGSDFRGANLSKTDFKGADLENIQWDEQTIWLDANLAEANNLPEALKIQLDLSP